MLINMMFLPTMQSDVAVAEILVPVPTPEEGGPHAPVGGPAPNHDPEIHLAEAEFEPSSSSYQSLLLL